MKYTLLKSKNTSLKISTLSNRNGGSFPLNILITGNPGVGKTSVLNRLKKAVQDQGYNAGGLYCPEIRVRGKRTGFSIIDISSGKEGVLATVGGEGPSVGRYGVNLEDLDRIGIPALERAVSEADFIFIDEIAPMELQSTKFSEMVEAALDSEKPVIGVIHKRSRHPFILKVKNRSDVTLIEVSTENRDFLHEDILEILK